MVSSVWADNVDVNSNRICVCSWETGVTNFLKITPLCFLWILLFSCFNKETFIDILFVHVLRQIYSIIIINLLPLSVNIFIFSFILSSIWFAERTYEQTEENKALRYAMIHVLKYTQMLSLTDSAFLRA
jgi:hypothetical protein